MTEQELIDIKSTINFLINEGNFKDTETAYNTAMNSLNTLEKAINYNRCCKSDSDQLCGLCKSKQTQTLGFCNDCFDTIYSHA